MKIEDSDALVFREHEHVWQLMESAILLEKWAKM
jgi:hypothetical protein